MSRWLVKVLALVCTFAGTPAWSQDLLEPEIVIEPQEPDSNDLITLSVTNSGCYSREQVFQELEENFIEVRLTYFVEYQEECFEENPDSPDFSTTVGPLAPGEYVVWFTQSLQGTHPRLADSQSFTVTEAPPGLPEGGINGFYYNPEADGHYFYVLHFDYGTLLMWSTFDADGEQAWVYAVGKQSKGYDAVLDAQAWINVGGRVSFNGVFDPAEDQRWGTLSVEMASCMEGLVRFDSDYPGYGSGEFPIRRLAFVKQLGCVDRAEAAD